MAKGYLPVSPKVLQATPLVNPKGRAELKFTAPKTPGRYPFLCTFPGHWRLMRGELIVDGGNWLGRRGMGRFLPRQPFAPVL